MKKMPTIKSVMTPFPHSIGCDESLRRAELMMAEHGIRHLPVVREGELFSIITDSEVRRVRDRLPPGEAVAEIPVRKICSEGVCIIDLQRTLDSVLEEMADRQADSVLVVKEGRLVGIVTKTDLCRSYCELLRSIFPEGGKGDAA